MEGSLLLISILVFIAIVLFISGIYFYIDYRKEHLRLLERIKRQTGEETWSAKKSDAFHIFKNDLLRMVGSLGDRLKPKDEEELSHLRMKFLRAGYRGENLTVIFFGVKALLAILLAGGFFLSRFFILKTLAPLRIMLFSVLFALIGFYLPSLWLQARIARRKEEILKAFPDALDLMVVCVEAGVGLDAAINRVGEELRLRSRVLADEFRLLSLELRAGKSRQDALRNLALRVDLEDVSSWTTLLIQTDKFGTSVGQALRVHSDSMRTKRRQRAEEVAGKMAVKLIFPLIFFIFPALFVVILGPAAIRLARVMLPMLNQ